MRLWGSRWVKDEEHLKKTYLSFTLTVIIGCIGAILSGFGTLSLLTAIGDGVFGSLFISFCMAFLIGYMIITPEMLELQEIQTKLETKKNLEVD